MLSNMVSEQENRKLRGVKQRTVVLDLDELNDMARMTMQSEQKTFVLPDARLKRIDCVIVYPKKSLDEIHEEDDQIKFQKQQELRHKFQAALLAEGVLIQRDVIGENVMLKLHVPFQRLCEEAEKTKLEMPLSGCEIYDEDENASRNCWNRVEEKYFETDDEVDFVTAPFEMDKMYVFKGFENPDTFFRSALRYYLINHMLINIDITDPNDKDTYVDDDPMAKKGLPYLIMKHAFKDQFVLHDEAATDPMELTEHEEKFALTGSIAVCQKKQLLLPDTRQELQDTWGCFFKYQPLWKIRNYFGEKIALYFAWSGMLITSLWIPTIFGICVFAYGLKVSITEAEPAPSTANMTATEKVAQMVDASIGVFKKSFDNAITPFYTLIICLWGTIFLEVWKRKNATLAYEWDVDTFEQNEPDRPEFYGTKSKPDPIIPGEETMFYPAYKQFLKFAASASTLIFMMMLVFTSVVAVITYRVIMSVRFCNTTTECLLLTTILSSVFNAVSILILGKIYEKLAVKLTDWENHRTQTRYDDALIIKLFAFQFVNNYTSLFYIAFFRGARFGSYGMWGMGEEYQDSCGVNNNCMSMLSFQVLVLMLAKPLPKFISDLVIPFLKKKWRVRQFCRCASKVHDEEQDGSLSEGKDFIEREREKPDLGDFTLGEYTEKVVVYGFLMLFAASFPLAPLIALLVTMVDIRIDCRRMLWMFRRPVGQIAQDIGTWYSILQFLNILGVVSNAFLVAFTSNWGKNFTITEKLWIVIGFEHLVFLVKFVIATTIPDVPSDVILQNRKEKYQVQHILENAKPKSLEEIAHMITHSSAVNIEDLSNHIPLSETLMAVESGDTVGLLTSVSNNRSTSVQQKCSVDNRESIEPGDMESQKVQHRKPHRLKPLAPSSGNTDDEERSPREPRKQRKRPLAERLQHRDEPKDHAGPVRFADEMDQESHA